MKILLLALLVEWRCWERVALSHIRITAGTAITVMGIMAVMATTTAGTTGTIMEAVCTCTGDNHEGWRGDSRQPLNLTRMVLS